MQGRMNASAALLLESMSKRDVRTWITKLLGSALVGWLVVFAVGCSNPIDGAAGIPIPDEARKSQIDSSLAPGDTISVSYPGAPELNLSQKIRADGRVSLPMIGDVSAAGRSLSSFQSSLHSRYEDLLQDSKVVVNVVQAAAAVYVSGEVRQPGKIALDRPMTALDAIMESGGFVPTADPKKVSVVRTVKGAHQRYNLNMVDALAGRAPAFYLKPFDVIYVGQRMW